MEGGGAVVHWSSYQQEFEMQHNAGIKKSILFLPVYITKLHSSHRHDFSCSRSRCVFLLAGLHRGACQSPGHAHNRLVDGARDCFKHRHSSLSR